MGVGVGVMRRTGLIDRMVEGLSFGARVESELR